MRGEKFRSRDKKVQKLGRDGLVEKNQATGEERRVSHRAADISFERGREPEPEVRQSRTRQKKRRKKQPPVQQISEPLLFDAANSQSLPDADATEAPALSMRGACDMPVVAPLPDTSREPSEKPQRRRGRGKRKVTEKRTGGHEKSVASSVPTQERSERKKRQKDVFDSQHQDDRERTTGDGEDKLPPFHEAIDTALVETPPDEDGAPLLERSTDDAPFPERSKASAPILNLSKGRDFVPTRSQVDVSFSELREDSRFLPGHSKTDHPISEHSKNSVFFPGQREDRFLFPERSKTDTPIPEDSSGSPVSLDHPSREDTPSPEDRPKEDSGKLRFEGARDPPSTSQRTKSTSALPDHSRPLRSQNAIRDKRVEADFRPREMQIPIDRYETASPRTQPMPDVPSNDESPPMETQEQNSVPPPAGAEPKRQHLQFKEHLRFEDAPKDEVSPENTSVSRRRRQQRKYHQAEYRAKQAEEKLEKARNDLPTKRHVHLEKQYDGESGKVHHRLRFEEEVLPEYVKPSLPAQAARAAKTAAVLKFHSKLRESERENVAVEAAHKTEFTVERGAGQFLRWNRSRRRSKPYRAVRLAEREAVEARANLAWQTSLRDNPELRRKNALAKWMQKRKIKRQYAQAAHEARQTARFTQNVLAENGKIARIVAQYASAHKSMFLIVALLVLIVTLFSAGLTSCAAMLSGIQSSYLSATFLSNEQDICQSDLYFTELETDLQLDINSTETNFPGYDEYRYNIGEISHNPYELLSYLSAAYDIFSFADVEAEIQRIFNEKYQLTRTVLTETRYDADGSPYDWTVLQTTLTVRRMGDVIAESLTDPDRIDRYNVYMQTYGGRQAYGNPFDFPWLGYVSSAYGYRVHPINGGKNLHRGVDIAVAQGTEIHAAQDGRIISAGDTGDYGLCVVIEDEKGYQSRYAHCTSLNVTTGQEVKRGDVIAAVGSTGQSTGPHLHLEVLLNGEYLNPYFFVENGGAGGGALPGTPGGPVIPDNPGEPMGDRTFEAMLQEAEKYLGYPYVWGGSSPATSFDCSGYVSWVINHSGWNVGRLGVLGLEGISTPVSKANAKPGDLIFFANTYDAPLPGPTHVGIYVGGGRFIHCGNPISYANLSSSYWTAHFWGFGRLPGLEGTS